MWALEPMLALGQSSAFPERLSRHIRISNAVALLSATLAVASIPFDLLTGPSWFLVSDSVALAGSIACWMLNARGHRYASRVMMLLALNLVFLHATIRLGEESDQRVVFFALAIAPFLVFALDERLFLVPLVVLPIVEYFMIAFVVPSGPPTEFAVTAYRVYSAVLAFTGLIGGLIVFARANNRAERALHSQQRLVEETRARSVTSARLAALGEMSSGVAHEIRNPLTAINLAADQITAQALTSANVAATAERIHRAATRISTIVDALLSFARDAGGDPAVAIPVEELFENTLALCHTRFVEHDIELSVPPVPASLIVPGRAVQLEQVLLNLLGNAYDAVQSVPDRWVRLEARCDDGWVEISVSDSGPGIPAALRARIFEPFFTTKPLDRGTGLGLSLSRGIIEAHHGTLTLDECSPHTRFVIRLPQDQSRAG